MTYKEKCMAEFSEFIEDQKIDELEKKFAELVFSSGFDYGCLSGASDEIKESVVKNINPNKGKEAKEIVEKIRDLLR